MKRSAIALPLTLVASAILLACTDIPTGSDDILSFQLNALPSPSVVVGDTLRDSSGVVTPVTVTAFNYENEVIESVPARFRALDARVRVDSITGVVIGDTVSTTPSRILATFGGFNAFLNIPVTLRPDTIVPANDRDSLGYSLTDTASNLSNALGVRVLHGLATTDSVVQFYRVSFEIVSPADTALARLVTDARVRSSVDTTNSEGIASRRLKIDVTRLTAAQDSVVLRAHVRYRGQHVRGSPMRLVLKLRPR